VTWTVADPSNVVANAFRLFVIETGKTVSFRLVRSIVFVSDGLVVNVPSDAAWSATIQVAPPYARPVRTTEPVPRCVYVTFAT
jgi:hypothetical protein